LRTDGWTEEDKPIIDRFNRLFSGIGAPDQRLVAGPPTTGTRKAGNAQLEHGSGRTNLEPPSGEDLGIFEPEISVSPPVSVDIAPRVNLATSNKSNVINSSISQVQRSVKFGGKRSFFGLLRSVLKRYLPARIAKYVAPIAIVGGGLMIGLAGPTFGASVAIGVGILIITAAVLGLTVAVKMGFSKEGRKTSLGYQKLPSMNPDRYHRSRHRDRTSLLTGRPTRRD
ncbi:hypothetical protein EBR96_07110, partial [bacterium]|nr:hypothetical protein [bacterium]